MNVNVFSARCLLTAFSQHLSRNSGQSPADLVAHMVLASAPPSTSTSWQGSSVHRPGTPTMVDYEGLGSVVSASSYLLTRARLRLIQQSRPRSGSRRLTGDMERMRLQAAPPIERLRSAQHKGDLAAINEALAASTATIGSNREIMTMWRAALFEDAPRDDEIAASRLQRWHKRAKERTKDRLQQQQRSQQLLQPAKQEPRPEGAGSPFRLRHYQQPWWHSSSEPESHPWRSPERVGRGLNDATRDDRINMQIASIHDQVRQRVQISRGGSPIKWSRPLAVGTGGAAAGEPRAGASPAHTAQAHSAITSAHWAGGGCRISTCTSAASRPFGTAPSAPTSSMDADTDLSWVR